MNIIDISMGIHEGMPVYKGRMEKQPRLSREKRMPEDSINESAIAMNLHTGTHLDTPLHMQQGGWPMEEMPLDSLLGPCTVFDLTRVEDCVTADDLKGLDIRQGDFVLLKTKNSFGLAGKENFIYIRQDAARFLTGKGIRGIGTDALGVERDQPGHETHLAFFDSGVLILEGLDLSPAPAGNYTLLVLPLKIRGAEGAPARAVLLEHPDTF